MQDAVKPRKTPRQLRAQATVETILEATARVLAAHGYAGTNTNRVAELAGVSVGSIYQYFPNKTALVAALHERHVQQMGGLIQREMAAAPAETLADWVRQLVRVVIAAHRLEPELHRILEREFAGLELSHADSPADQAMEQQVLAMLTRYRTELGVADLPLATYVSLRMLESLVHAAVLEPPADIAADKLEAAIVDALLGYLLRPVAR